MRSLWNSERHRFWKINVDGILFDFGRGAGESNENEDGQLWHNCIQDEVKE